MTIFFVLFVIGIALALQKLSGERGLEAVEGDHRPDRPIVEQGEAFSVEVHLTNGSRRFVTYLRVRQWFPSQFSFGESIGAAIREHRGGSHVEFTTWLRPRQRLTRSIPVSISTRGRYVLSELHLFGGDFLGLHEHEKLCGRFNEVVVPPGEIASPRLMEVLGGFLGEVSVNRFILEDPVLTLGYREYTGREPMKMISWAQSARGSGLMVKKSDHTVEPTISVVLNVESDHPQREELLETCFSLARTVCAALERRGVKYSFTSNAALAGYFDTSAAGEGLGPRHFCGVLEHLGRATCEAHIPLARLLEREMHRPASVGRILITPGDEPAAARAVNRLREAAGGNLLVFRGTEATQW